MDHIFNIILDSKNIEQKFHEITDVKLHDYYALMISAMAFYQYITLTPKFATELHTCIVNTSLPDVNSVLHGINKFIINKQIEQIEKEINNI